jgi:hypothetical protein
MHITPTNEDPEFRKAAKAVHLPAEDMIPMKGQSGSWCLPLEQLSATPAIKGLYFRFEKTKVC